MNTINIVNDKIKTSSKLIIKSNFKNESFSVNKIEINIDSNEDVIINYKGSNQKINFILNISNNTNIFFFLKGNNLKIQYTFNLINSSSYIFKFNDARVLRERTFINLSNSTIEYNLKTIAKTKEEYDFITNHNTSNSISDLSLNGVSMKQGNISFNVTGIVESGNKNCNVKQESKIINLNDSSSIIKPNLLIDEYDVTANHSALIGKFDKNTIFYLKSRGINEKEAFKLLIKGLLLNNFKIFNKDKIEKTIDKYWR